LANKFHSASGGGDEPLEFNLERERAPTWFCECYIFKSHRPRVLRKSECDFVGAAIRHIIFLWPSEGSASTMDLLGLLLIVRG